MRLIGLAVLIIVVSLVAPFDPLTGEGTKGWYLLEPPVDETSNVLFGKTSPLPKLEIFKGAYRDSGLANASICVTADEPRLTSGLRGNRRHDPD